MKTTLLFAVSLAAIVGAGCATGTPKPVANPAATGLQPSIVTPAVSLAAEVISVNDVGRFVVLRFPGGNLPKLQQTLSLYRAGLKVGLVKISGPQSDNHIVADILSGEVKVGDKVRDE